MPDITHATIDELVEEIARRQPTSAVIAIERPTNLAASRPTIYRIVGNQATAFGMARILCNLAESSLMDCFMEPPEEGEEWRE
jgi:hypothetical protein